MHLYYCTVMTDSLLRTYSSMGGASEKQWVNEAMLEPHLFLPTEDDIATYGQYYISEPELYAEPADVPKDWVAYNPSGIWTTLDTRGNAQDIMYVRVEPDRSDPGVSHLGKAVARPYIVNPNNPTQALVPYYEAQEIPGEDPSLTRINRRLPVSGKLESVWLLGVVDAQPMPDIANEVGSLHTNFYMGESLNKLEHVATGPAWMKDIRVAAVDTTNTELDVWGRPQTQDYSGNITHVRVGNIEELTAESIAGAPVVHDQLLPIGSGLWGGVNDAIKVSRNKYILAAHRACRAGDDGSGRHYEAVLYGHNVETQTIVDLGVLATAKSFPPGKVKDNIDVDLHDVVFTGGAYNGRLTHLTFGVRDGTIGIARIHRTP